MSQMVIFSNISLSKNQFLDLLKNFFGAEQMRLTEREWKANVEKGNSFVGNMSWSDKEKVFLR